MNQHNILELLIGYFFINIVKRIYDPNYQTVLRGSLMQYMMVVIVR